MKKIIFYGGHETAIIYNLYGGHPSASRPALTNDLCGQYVKVKVKTSAVFDFNILTALKGWVGQAAKRTGALHISIHPTQSPTG